MIKLTESALRRIIKQELKEMMDAPKPTFQIRKKVYLSKRQASDASYGGYGGVEKDDKGYYRYDWVKIPEEEYDRLLNLVYDEGHEEYSEDDFRDTRPSDYDYGDDE